MITIRPIMNSAVEEIFAFKTCCGLKVFDQNLEIHMTNLGVAPVRIQGYFDLALPSGVHRVETLFPPGELLIAPGEIRAFYCTMDETLWEDAESMTFRDTDGRNYRCPVTRTTGHPQPTTNG
jgi:hypothetical protein